MCISSRVLESTVIMPTDHSSVLLFSILLWFVFADWSPFRPGLT